jgi:hypothetical protein
MTEVENVVHEFEGRNKPVGLVTGKWGVEKRDNKILIYGDWKSVVVEFHEVMRNRYVVEFLDGSALVHHEYEEYLGGECVSRAQRDYIVNDLETLRGFVEVLALFAKGNAWDAFQYVEIAFRKFLNNEIRPNIERLKSEAWMYHVNEWERHWEAVFGKR